MYDNEIMFYDKIVTADEAGAFVAYPEVDHPLELRIVVPSLAETGDTIDVTITLSDDGTNAKEVITMPQITYAQVVTSKITEFYTVMPMHRGYIKVALNVTDADTGSDFTTTTKLRCGLVPAGRYNVR